MILVGDHSQGPSRGKYAIGCRCPGCRECERVYKHNYRAGIPNPSASLGHFGQKYAPRHNLQTVWELWDCTPTLVEWRQARDLAV